MTAKLLSRMDEPLTLSPLRGARDSRDTHGECPSPRLAGRRCRKAADEGRSPANLDSTDRGQQASLAHRARWYHGGDQHAGGRQVDGTRQQRRAATAAGANARRDGATNNTQDLGMRNRLTRIVCGIPPAVTT